jgi:adenosylcobyric acid synthase
VAVLGVLPFRDDLQIDQEDSLGLDQTANAPADPAGPDALDVAVARLPGLSNATDFWPLARTPGVQLRYVARGTELGRPDLIILPGTKSTAGDLDWLRHVGLAEAIGRVMAGPDRPVLLGICGGYQMLGHWIDDPLGVESDRRRVAGLGLLDVSTRFAAEKARHRVSGHVIGEDIPVVGYEIHMGFTERGPGAVPWMTLVRAHDGTFVHDGARAPAAPVFGTYVHGLFDSLPLTAALVNRLRQARGLGPLDTARWQAHRDVLAERYAKLAELLRAHVDLEPIWAALERSWPHREPDVS